MKVWHYLLKVNTHFCKILSSFEGAQTFSDSYVHPSTTVKLPSQATELTLKAIHEFEKNIGKSLRPLQMTSQSHCRKSIV